MSFQTCASHKITGYNQQLDMLLVDGMILNLSIMLSNSQPFIALRCKMHCYGLWTRG